MAEQRQEIAPARGQSLVDVLDRILDKGLVVAGDIRIRLADVELLTIQIRLLVCSVDKAEEIGLDWWRTDGRLSSGASDGSSLAALNDRMESLSDRLAEIEEQSSDRGGPEA